MSSAPTKTDGLTDLLSRLRIVPVVVINRLGDAEPLAQALLAGDLRCAEVTFRTPTAEDAIKEMSAVEGLAVGAGTVIRPDQVERAVDAGAQFIVSPGFSAAVVAACREHDVPVITGAATATEIQMALESGQNVVKLFPAEAIGGLKLVRALSAPFPAVRFVPTGGITQDSACSYLEHPSVLAVGGSWMVAAELLAASNFAEVTRLASAAVAAARTVKNQES